MICWTSLNSENEAVPGKKATAQSISSHLIWRLYVCVCVVFLSALHLQVDCKGLAPTQMHTHIANRMYNSNEFPSECTLVCLLPFYPWQTTIGQTRKIMSSRGWSWWHNEKWRRGKKAFHKSSDCEQKKATHSYGYALYLWRLFWLTAPSSLAVSGEKVQNKEQDCHRQRRHIHTHTHLRWIIFIGEYEQHPLQL